MPSSDHMPSRWVMAHIAGVDRSCGMVKRAYCLCRQIGCTLGVACSRSIRWHCDHLFLVIKTVVAPHLGCSASPFRPHHRSPHACWPHDPNWASQVAHLHCTCSLLRSYLARRTSQFVGLCTHPMHTSVAEDSDTGGIADMVVVEVVDSLGFAFVEMDNMHCNRLSIHNSTLRRSRDSALNTK